ncbi:MAG: UbiA family prenyltransferase [Candidatus Bathyarchaeota archaeon]|jgi:4-hydroxybenzoate polyprenyltransferase|nr:UbiA family prenyltransferase [Candidatus Bathyarchaeota archaeon]
MLASIKALGTISRAEFLLPNLGSLIMGLAWGATASTSIGELAVLIALSFAIINLSSAIGAQANTLSDRELDAKDERKTQLVEAMNSFGERRLKTVLAIEFTLTLILVSTFMYVQQRIILLLLWILGISLGGAYSLPPARLKSRSWLAPVSLILVLAFFPVLFAYYSFTDELNPFFLMSLTGLALTVYGVIVPTEIRDYFGDKSISIETFTVHIGLVKASMLAILLLSAGAMLTAVAFLLQFAYGQRLFLGSLVAAIPIAAFTVLKQFRKLHILAREYASTKDESVKNQIVSVSSQNPRWIMIITQTYSIISVVMLASKFLL